ncbi:MAG: cobalt transporter CbiM [Leptolyngbyaceae bacterium]|nr:cobalt transporter CbiM [Leptolyngbyaceae bacterium]
MHVPDGILPAQVSAVGYAIATPFIGYALRTINRSTSPVEVNRTIPKAALLTATFFVASSLYIPIPPFGSVHLLMNGLLGAMLGYYAVPAIVIGLFFQALLIGHGGYLSLGINVLLMGIPAILAHHIFQLRHRFLPRFNRQTVYAVFGTLAGCIGILGSALIFFGVVIMTIPADINAATERTAIYVLMLMHLPIALLEGAFTASFIVFLLRTKPELVERTGLRSPLPSPQKQAEQG